jgi:8-hydroxy-5-deazaflavin:NADPH oxidoreductase
MMDRRTLLSTIGATLVTGALAGTVEAAEKKKLAILGTGNLGQALARCWTRTGHWIVFGSRTPAAERVRNLAMSIGPMVSVATVAQAVEQAEVVVFALPWKAAKDTVAAAGHMTGKVIIDPMNAIKWQNNYPEPPDIATSVAEELQALAPGAKVVKALNTPSSRNILDPARAGGHVGIPIAGADFAAKARVAALVSEIGLEPLDMGPLIAARYIEGMLRLAAGYVVYMKGKAQFEYSLVPVKI